MTDLTPVVQATRYTVNCVPAELTPDAHVFALQVNRKRDGLWVVTDGSSTLRADGTWSDEYGQHGYGAAYRHDLNTALELAKQAAPKVIVNGLTPAQAIARIERINAQEATA